MNIPDKFILSYGCLSKPISEQLKDLCITVEKLIEQCTGLKDKNGKLIYEGDIVKLNGKYEIGVYPIVYDESCCEYILTKNDKFIYEFYWEVAENCEVISNIHEKADLLGE